MFLPHYDNVVVLLITILTFENGTFHIKLSKPHPQYLVSKNKYMQIGSI